MLTALKTNIDSYVVAVMLSSNLHSYKGEGPVNHVLVSRPFTLDACVLNHAPQNILKKHRFDMPPGVENDAAKWKKVVAFVQSSFTERRSAWKKIVRMLYLYKLCTEYMS